MQVFIGSLAGTFLRIAIAFLLFLPIDTVHGQDTETNGGKQLPSPKCLAISKMAKPPEPISGTDHFPPEYASKDRCPPGYVEQPDCGGMCNAGKGMPKLNDPALASPKE